MDTRRWGPGERIVFEPYSREVYEQSFEWIEKHGIFEAGKMGDGIYDKSVVSVRDVIRPTRALIQQRPAG